MDLKIEGMACGGCAKSVTKAIQSVDPKARVETNLPDRTAKVETSAAQAAILRALAEAGYPASAS